MVKVKNKIVDLVKVCDIFGESFTFKVRKNSNYTSVVGGLTSIAFVLYTIYYLSLSSNDFFNKRNRNINLESKVESHIETKFSEHSNFTIAFCLRDKYMAIDQFLNNYTDINIKLISNQLENKKINQTVLPLNLESCSESMFKQTMMNIYNLKDYSGCSCLDFSRIVSNKEYENKSNLLSLFTKSDGVNKRYLELNLQPKNKKQEYFQYLKENKSKFYVYLPSYTIETSSNINDNNPLKSYIQSFNYDLKPFSQLVSNLDMAILNFKDYYSLYNEGISKI